MWWGHWGKSRETCKGSALGDSIHALSTWVDLIQRKRTKMTVQSTYNFSHCWPNRGIDVAVFQCNMEIIPVYVDLYAPLCSIKPWERLRSSEKYCNAELCTLISVMLSSHDEHIICSKQQWIGNLMSRRFEFVCRFWRPTVVNYYTLSAQAMVAFVKYLNCYKDWKMPDTKRKKLQALAPKVRHLNP